MISSLIKALTRWLYADAPDDGERLHQARAAFTYFKTSYDAAEHRRDYRSMAYWQSRMGAANLELLKAECAFPVDSKAVRG